MSVAGIRPEEISLDANNLWREETYTDLRIGTIRVLYPVNSDGTPDATRKPRFTGSIQLLTPAGVLPVSFPIEAESLAEAVKKFPEAAKKGLEETRRELEELRREAASSIVAARPEDLQKLQQGGPLGGQGGQGPLGGSGGGLILP